MRNAHLKLPKKKFLTNILPRFLLQDGQVMLDLQLVQRDITEEILCPTEATEDFYVFIINLTPIFWKFYYIISLIFVMCVYIYWILALILFSE